MCVTCKGKASLGLTEIHYLGLVESLGNADGKEGLEKGGQIEAVAKSDERPFNI